MEPFSVKFNGESFLLTEGPKARAEYLVHHPEIDPREIGFCAIALFREHNYQDYLAVAEVNDVDGTEEWTRCYERLQLFDWMAGMVYDRDSDREKQRLDIEKRVGKFIVKYGWAPDLIIESEPSEEEYEAYLTYVVNKNVASDGNLYVPEDNNEN